MADVGVNIWNNVLCSLVNTGGGQPGLKILRKREPFLPLRVILYIILSLLWLLVLEHPLNVLLFLTRISIGLIRHDLDELNSVTGGKLPSSSWNAFALGFGCSYEREMASPIFTEDLKRTSKSLPTT